MEIDIDSRSDNSSESNINDRSPYTPPPKIRIPFDRYTIRNQEQELRQGKPQQKQIPILNHRSQEVQMLAQLPKKYTCWNYLCKILLCGRV